MNLYKKKPFQRHSEHFLIGYREEKGRESQPDRQAGLLNNKIPTTFDPESIPKPRNDGFFRTQVLCMKFIQVKLNLVLFVVLLSHGMADAQDSSKIKAHKRQFRGVWMATVRNLDWPSKPGLSNRRLKREYIEQIDKLKELGMNAVIVQVRPVGDAFYPSRLEPWSEFLTGKQGQAPVPFFDPLEFMIKAARERCLEFHAWFNPYRAIKHSEQASLSSQHVFYSHPEWFVRYGNDTYFDPGMEPARKFVEKVIADVVSRYDVDAVHFDDYYYPYRIEGQEFPDTLSFSIYHRGFTQDKKEDWRRDNINLLVKELADTINQIKPWVHFGISPFGVWRNKSQDPDGSDTQTLQTNYDDLFGDAQAWLRNGWLDYILPQCYQYLGRDIMDYRVVTRWWNDHNYGVNFYIGQGPFRLGNPDRGLPWVEGNEIGRQLYFNDSIPNLLGSAYFRSSTFLNNPMGVNELLKNKFYATPALPPPSHHDADKPFDIKIKTVEYRKKRKKIFLKWEVDKPEEVRYFVVYKSDNIEDPENVISITSQTSLSIKTKLLGPSPHTFWVTAVDRYRQESEAFYLSEATSKN